MRILTLALAALGLSPGAYAQIPVTDAAQISQQATQHVESVAKYVEQIQHLKLQVEQMRQQYAAITGGRGLGAILNDPRLREYLPDEWKQVYDAVRNGDLSGLTQEARRIYGDQADDPCQTLPTGNQALCRAQRAKPAQDKAFADAAYDRAQQRLSQIEDLMRQINTTEDPKAIAELQARIAIEQAMVQNEQTKLQLFALASQAEDRLQAQQRRARMMQTFSNTTTPIIPANAAPLTFGAQP